MSEEKMLYEVKITETEDGYRIEIKGDKEHLKQMGIGPGMRFGPGRGSGSGFGPFGGPFRHAMRRRMQHMRHHMHGHGPWGWWWDEAAEPKAPASGPEADF